MFKNKDLIQKAKQELKLNGIALIKNYMSDSVELLELKKKIYQLVCIKAKLYKLDLPNNDPNFINDTIIKLHSINNKIGAFLNDSLNSSPELFKILSSTNITELGNYILDIRNDSLLSNNHRIRVQIPGRDGVSNLPWHQDSHYNNFYLKNNSVVIWISVSDIDNDAGPIVYKKGSQINNQVERLDFKKPNNLNAYTLPDKYINDKRFKEESIPTKSGDVLLIDMDLIHRSGLNKSEKVKFSLQARFHNASNPNFLPQYS